MSNEEEVIEFYRERLTGWARNLYNKDYWRGCLDTLYLEKLITKEQYLQEKEKLDAPSKSE